MSKPLTNAIRMTLVIVLGCVVMTGCGRKGGLDRPSTPVEEQNIRKTSKPGEQKSKEPVEERPFLLDPLL